MQVLPVHIQIQGITGDIWFENKPEILGRCASVCKKLGGYDTEILTRDAYAQTRSVLSQEPVHRAIPSALTPKQLTRFS